jgi:arylsulfatase A
MGPLRGLKRDIWEGGHRVPFLVRWPGKVKAGAVSDALISQVDIMATIAAVVGAELPATSADDSHNQLPLWLGESSGSSRQSVVHNTFASAYAVRQGNWVLIDAKEGNHTKVPPTFNQANGYEANTQSGQLFDLSADLPQRVNRYADMPEKVAELRSLLERTRNKGEVRAGPPSALAK